ncbi:MAG: hypothetical protein EPN23_02715 [Verrucomicrobia bacterium]|nr:MAG: hypothetical protein EPN23_02715 [Verrucomicrobiota bacterium]
MKTAVSRCWFFQGLEKVQVPFSKAWKKVGTARRAVRGGRSATALPIILICAALLSASASARVFESWRARGSDPVRAVMVGEQAAYHTAMELNGAAAGMEVYGCAGSPSKVLERLIAAYQALGAQAFCVSGDKLGWGVVLLDGRVIRLLVADTGQHGMSTLFRLNQSEADFARSQQPPTAALPPSVPTFPGSQWTQTIRNETANSTVATATVTADPTAVLRYYAGAMPQAGWQPGLGSHDEISGIYVRGRDLLLVAANSTGVRGRTVVILLHKRLK